MIYETLILAKNVAIFFCSWSYEIGKLIVTLICLLIKSLYVGSAKLANLLQIIVGDFRIFIQDVNRESSYIVNSVLEIYNFFLRSVDQVILCFRNYFTIIGDEIYRFFPNYNLLHGSVNFFKELIELIGSALCLLIKLPYTVLLSLVQCIYILPEIPLKINSFLKELYTSLLRVSVESMVGIIFFSIFVYFLVRFRKFLVIICRRLTLILIYTVQQKISKFFLRRFWTRSIEPIPRRDVTDREVDENYLCIVCQSTPRCIVLMPCKHLCLCDNCSFTLTRIYKTNSCPVCRQEISFKLKVFL